ncbi:MAG: hypothetical protein KC486_05595 [Myxococcales bacterium]|nr:hypothetical protein [Myxococcales bacterium]
MDVQKQLHELEEVAKSLGVRVSYDPMHGPSKGGGGLCRVRGEYRVIVDKRLRPSERVRVLAEALRSFDTEGIFVSPQIRQLLSE